MKDDEVSSSKLSGKKLRAEDPRLVVVAPSFYTDASDVRYSIALECCKLASQHAIDVIFIDASPSQSIREGLEAAGGGFVQVFQQTATGKKGAALREGIRRAAQRLRDETGDTTKARRAIIGFQEPEKDDMMRHWNSIASYMQTSGSDIVSVRRRDQEFRATYPIEQYHSEQFANMFLDSLGRQIGLASLDWTSGPVALDLSLADQWLDCDGEIWDAQLLPIVDAFVNRKATVTSFEVDYKHPKLMKEQEGGNPKFNEKRLYQLNFLSETVGERMREAAAKLSK